ncbi:MAG: SufD family Fe-S cluster assembly protein [Candidatus Aenigmatarchaeota archaeon]
MIEFNKISEEKIIEFSKERNEPQWLTEFRVKSFRKFLELPPETSPLYAKYSRITDFNINEINPKINSEESLKVKYRESSVEIDDIFYSLNSYSELKKYFNNLPNDKFLCLNNALFNSGIFVRVPKNTETNFPLELFYEIDKNSVFSKNIFILEENSSLNVFEYKSSKSKEINNMCSVSSEFFLKNSSQLTYCSIENFDKNLINLSHKKSFCEENSKMIFTHGIFGGAITKSKVDCFLVGIGASVENFQIISAKENQRFDSDLNSYHLSKLTSSLSVSRSVLQDKSQAIVKGKIKIENIAKNSQAYLSEHGLLLSKDANADIIPSLEIETNEVKATHSASVSHLDEEQIFYLQSRGIKEDLAKNLLVLSFFDPIISRIPNEDIIKIVLENIEQNIFGKKDIIPLEMKNKIISDSLEKHYKYR